MSSRRAAPLHLITSASTNHIGSGKRVLPRPAHQHCSKKRPVERSSYSISAQHTLPVFTAMAPVTARTKFAPPPASWRRRGSRPSRDLSLSAPVGRHHFDPSISTMIHRGLRSDWPSLRGLPPRTGFLSAHKWASTPPTSRVMHCLPRETLLVRVGATKVILGRRRLPTSILCNHMYP